MAKLEVRPPTADTTANLIAALTDVVGADNIDCAANARALASQDVYRSGDLALAVVRPASTDEVSRVVAATTAAGVAVFVRGGGMSYTDAYLPDRETAIVLSTDRLNAIREINAQDLYATVEAGCTWQTLDAALAKQGVRAIFWGPMSGGVATVGGGMSLGAVTFGSGRNGPSMAAAIGLEVVAADGRVVVTGSSAQPGHSAFYRDYGPDLTGLLCGDSGALGVKTAITLRLEPRPATGAGLSFSFPDFPALAAAVGEVSRQGLATEVFGAETALVEFVAGPPDLRNDFKQLLSILRGAPSLFAAIKNGFSAAVYGRRFLKQSKFLVNFLTEGADQAELRRLLGRIRAAIGTSGVEVANTVAEFTRAVPFPDPAVLGPGGRRLLPLHGVVPYSRAEALNTAIKRYLEQQQSACDKADVKAFVVYATCGSAGFLYEPVLYWRDDWPVLHRQTTTDEVLATMQEHRPNPAGRDLVETMRCDLVDIMYEHGATHFQIGRAYPYLR